MLEISRPVKEEDFRKTEFANAKVEDYEFRDDGAIVRKDRWQTAISNIRHMVGISNREYEISDVVDAVEKLSKGEAVWVSLEHYTIEESEALNCKFDIKLTDNSILRNCYVHFYKTNEPYWVWNNNGGKFQMHEVAFFREMSND